MFPITKFITTTKNTLPNRFIYHTYTTYHIPHLADAILIASINGFALIDRIYTMFQTRPTEKFNRSSSVPHSRHYKLAAIDLDTKYIHEFAHNMHKAVHSDRTSYILLSIIFNVYIAKTRRLSYP